MITASDMIQKIGKRKFIETAVHSQPAQTGAYLAHKRRWGKNLKFKRCEHGVWVVNNYKRQDCARCFVSSEAFTIHTDSGEYFNLGTGTYGTTKEHRRYAKTIRLREAG